MKEESKNISFKKTVETLWWLWRLWMRLDLVGFLGYLVTDIAEPLSTVARWYVLAYFIDQAAAYSKNGGDVISYMWSPSLVFVLFYLGGRLLSLAGTYFDNRRKLRIEWKLEELFVQKVEELSLYDIDNRSFANKLSLANEAKENLIPKLSNAISIGRNIIVTLLIGLPLVFQGYWYVFVGMILLSIPSIRVNMKFQQQQIKLKLSRVETRRKSIEALEVHTGITEASKEIKINNAYDILREKGVTQKRLYNELLLSHQKVWLLGRSGATIAETLLMSGFVIYFIWNAIQGVGSISGVIPFYGTILNIRVTVYNFMNSLTQLAEYYEEIFRVRDFLSYVPRQLFSKHKQNIDIASAPGITVEDVTFSYPDTAHAVLKNLSLSIKPKEKVALVGVNGAGKTTLIKLILGMYPVNAGSIRVDGKDLFSFIKRQWYSTVGVLFQEFPKYGFLSVKENLLIGQPSVKDESLMWEALKKAEAKNFVEAYEKGLDQGLNHRYEKGISPSTGQWQKLAIARMFFRNPAFVIFDEPTASIDAESEFNIFNEIFKFFRDRTVLIVSHRFSTVKNADKIIVLSEGRIAEQGTHMELMKLDGLYAQSYKKQSEGYKD